MSACVCVWHIWHNRKNADQKNEMKETKSSSLLSSGVATRCRHRLFDSIHCCCCCRKWISSVLILNVYHSKRIIGFMYWRAPFTQWHFWREQVIVALINGLIKSRPDEWEEPKKHHPRRRYYTLSVRRVRNDATRINVQTYGWVRCGQMEELIGARTNNYCCSFTNLYIAIGMCLCAMKIEKKKNPYESQDWRCLCARLVCGSFIEFTIHISCMPIAPTLTYIFPNGAANSSWVILVFNAYHSLLLHLYFSFGAQQWILDSCVYGHKYYCETIPYAIANEFAISRFSNGSNARTLASAPNLTFRLNDTATYISVRWSSGQIARLWILLMRYATKRRTNIDESLEKKKKKCRHRPCAAHRWYTRESIIIAIVFYLYFSSFTYR